jgi:cytochrome d ubiquinol oxidase subunit II
MAESWYAILAVLAAVFVVLDGWNIGVGMLLFRLGRDEDERHALVAALGPSWAWNEVWLMVFGGCLFLAFPAVYAAAFSGCYLGLMLLLWLLVLRGIAIEFRHLVEDRHWRHWWDGVLRFASVGLGLVIGLACANVLRGVPLDAQGWFALPLFTDFWVGAEPGLVDWYTLTAALALVAALAAHGAGYSALHLGGELRERACRSALRWWIAATALLLAMTAATAAVRPQFLLALGHRPLGWACMTALASGVALAITGAVARAPRRLFAGGCLALAAIVLGGAVGVYPDLLRSSGPGPALTVAGASAPEHDLALALPWGLLGIALAAGYLLVLLRLARARGRG